MLKKPHPVAIELPKHDPSYIKEDDINSVYADLGLYNSRFRNCPDIKQRKLLPGKDMPHGIHQLRNGDKDPTLINLLEDNAISPGYELPILLQHLDHLFRSDSFSSRFLPGSPVYLCYATSEEDLQACHEDLFKLLNQRDTNMLTLLDLDLNEGSGKEAKIGNVGENEPQGSKIYKNYIKHISTKNNQTLVQSAAPDPAKTRFPLDGIFNQKLCITWKEKPEFKQSCQEWIQKLWAKNLVPLFYKLTNPNNQQDPSGTALVLNAFSDFVQKQTN